jgi:hypothetical protein
MGCWKNLSGDLLFDSSSSADNAVSTSPTSSGTGRAVLHVVHVLVQSPGRGGRPQKLIPPRQGDACNRSRPSRKCHTSPARHSVLHPADIDRGRLSVREHDATASANRSLPS